VRALRRAALALAVLAAGSPLWAAAEESGAAERFLGIPAALWKTVNLALILGLLVWFLGKPFNTFFRKRREDLDEQIARARREQEEAARLAEEMTERLSKIERQVEEIRGRGEDEGLREKAALLKMTEEEADTLRRSATQEIEQHLAAARSRLARAATEIAATRAEEILRSAIDDDDRRRLLEESIERVAESR
jgi:F-type H+-transporting ATPase subunit b